MFRRILREQRRFILPLTIVLVVDIGIYAAAVYPLAARVADADNRAAAAEQARRTAESEYVAVRNVATSKSKAEDGLRTFYGTILPADLGAADRLTYLHLAQLAQETNLRLLRRSSTPTLVRDSVLERLKITLVLEGSYEDIRQFIYQLETAKAFVIIDEVTIDQARDASDDLSLSLQISTYYRVADHAS